MICPNCNTENPDQANFCRNCGTALSSVRPASTRQEQTTSESVRPSRSAFPDFIEHKANFNVGMNSIGGKIIITPTQLIFRAHSFNFGDLSDRVFEIKDIVGYKKGFLTFLYISFCNRPDIKLTVWGKDEIINQLEARRRAL